MKGETSTPPVFQPPEDNPRFPLLDSVRGIAAFIVLFSHIGVFFSPAGIFNEMFFRFDVGVAIFFAISGFLLYRPFLSARLNGTRKVRVRDYARRRFLRIVPGYWLALTVIGLSIGLPDIFTGNFWVYYGLLQGYDSELYRNGIGPAWTLTVEATFYVLLPFYAVACAALLARFSRRRAILLETALIVAVTVLLILLRGYLQTLPDSNLLREVFAGNHRTPLGCFEWFAVGMLLAILSVAVSGSKVRSRFVQTVTDFPLIYWFAAGFLFVFAYRESPQALPGQLHGNTLNLIYGLIAVLFILPAVFGSDSGGLPRRILAFRPCVRLGVISYGFYLVQYPLIEEFGSRFGNELPANRVLVFLIAVAVIGGLSVLYGSLSYRFIERPLLKFKR